MAGYGANDTPVEFGGYGSGDTLVEIGAPEKKEQGFIGNVVDLVKSGASSALNSARLSGDVATGKFDPNAASVILDELQAGKQPKPKEFEDVAQSFAPITKEGDAAGKFTDHPLDNAAVIAKMIWNVGKQAVTNPKGLAYLTASQAANMAPSIAGMMAGAKGGAALGAVAVPVTGGASVPVGAIAGGVAGAFAGEWPMEAGSEFIGQIGKELAARNLDATEQNITALLQDKKFMAETVSSVRTKATVTSGIDAAFTLGAGRMLGAPERAAAKAARIELGAAATAEEVSRRAAQMVGERTLKQKGGNVARAVGVDVAGGGASEAGGQYAGYGKVDMGDVGMEMLGELGGAGIELPSSAWSAARGALNPEASSVPAEEALGAAPGMGVDTGSAPPWSNASAAQPDPLAPSATAFPDVNEAIQADELVQADAPNPMGRMAELDAEYANLQARKRELNDPANGYGPMFDTDRAEIFTRQMEIAQERAELELGRTAPQPDQPVDVAPPAAPLDTAAASMDEVRRQNEQRIQRMIDLAASRGDFEPVKTLPTGTPIVGNRPVSSIPSGRIAQVLDATTNPNERIALEQEMDRRGMEVPVSVEPATPLQESAPRLATQITDDERLAAKRAAFAMHKERGSPDDVASATVMRYQEQTNERGEPMNLWRAEKTGTAGFVPASMGSPFSVGSTLIATFHPEGADAGAVPAGVTGAPSVNEFDVSGRTDEQLANLVKAGKPGWREAAIAEVARRKPASLPVGSAARTLNEEGRATDGKPINPGDIFRTLSGRNATPYPKQKGQKYASQWLIDNATAEAELRGDEFNARMFKNSKPLKDGTLTTADREGMLMYLFSQQPDVVPSILKPLTGEAIAPKPSQPAQKESQAQGAEGKTVEVSPPATTKPDEVSAFDQRYPTIAAAEQAIKAKKLKQVAVFKDGDQYRIGAKNAGKAAPSNNLIQRIKQLGGIHTRYRTDVIGDKAGAPGLFSGTGKGLDDLATALQAEGFAIDTAEAGGGVDALTGLIQRAVNSGETVLNYAGQQAAAEKKIADDFRDNLKEEIAKLGGNPARNATTKQLIEMRDNLRAVAQQKTIEAAAQIETLIGKELTGADWDAILNASLPSVDQYAADLDQAALMQREQEENDAAYRRHEEETQVSAGQTPARGTRQGAEVGRAEQGNPEAQGSQEDFGLTGETPEEIRAREEAQAAKAKSEQDAADKAEAEAKKKRIDAEVASRQQASAENFVLGHGAEDALAGQGDIFGQPVKPATSTETSAGQPAANTPVPAQKTPDSAESDYKDRIHTLDVHEDLFKRVTAGTVTADEFKASFEALLENKDAIVAALSAMTKDAIFKRFPGLAYRYKSDKKAEVVDAAFRDMASDFVLGQGFSYGMGRDSFIDGIRAVVNRTTDQALSDHAAALSKAREERAVRRDQAVAGMADPQTLAETPRLSRAVPWYSPLNRAIQSAKRDTMPGEQWRLWLQGNKASLGVKDDELQFSGVLDYLELRGKDKVTKAEIADYLSGNGVVVQDVVKAEDMPIAEVRDMYIAAMKRQGASQSESESMFENMQAFSADYRAEYDEELKDRGFDLVMQDGTLTGNEIHNANSGSGAGDTKFSGYWDSSYKGGIPGTYREILVTLPAKTTANQSRAEYEEWARRKGYSANATFTEEKYKQETGKDAPPPRTMSAMAADEATNFKSGHWDEPNVLVHVRLDEVTGADGKRYVRVGEIQSDFGQAGRKEGFKGRTPTDAEVIEYFGLKEGADPAEYRQEMMDGVAKKGVPNAPFVTDTKSWIALGLKRAIQHAVEVGADGVVLGTGQQNADLYDLSKQVRKIDVEPYGGTEYRVIATDNNGGKAMDRIVDKSELSNYVGKEIAREVIDNGKRTFEGDGLKVGGEGMREFYDRIVPSVANEVLRKIGGGKVAAVDTEGGKQIGFTITQELREKLIEQGMPMFARNAGTGIPLSSAQAIADRIAAANKNMPKVSVFASPDDLDRSDQTQAALYSEIESAGALNDVEGAVHDGEIYLFSDHLADDIRAEHVLAIHEVTHHGLRKVFGAELNPILQSIWNNNANVRKRASVLGERLGMKSNTAAVEEVLADMTPAELVGVKGWRRLVLKVRDWLGEHGFKALSDRLTDLLNGTMDAQAQADMVVADIVRRAREFVRNGPPMSGGMAGAPSLSVTRKLSDDAAEQDAWLNREAKMRGYRDVDDLAEKAYPVFEKLAKKWREKHPADTALSIVWHGTPHIWAPEPGFPHGRPRLDKMGTGEGAQAFGWGWYSAESQGVAGSYRKNISHQYTFDGIPYSSASMAEKGFIEQFISYTERDGMTKEHAIASIIAEHEKSLDARLANLTEAKLKIGTTEDMGKGWGDLRYYEWSDKDVSAAELAVAEGRANLKQARQITPETVKRNEGSLYQLDIPDASLPFLLDWDKPLSEQTPEVRKSLEPWLATWRADKMDLLKAFGPDAARKEVAQSEKELTGETVYQAVGLNKGGDKAASEYLASLGIVGNRYLDGQSRKDGAGSYNYVIWSQPTLDKIALLERNGEKLDAMREADAQFSRKLADHLPAQENWLNTEARMRGFQDIEDLAAKDYKVFENLAKLWREKHPADAMLSLMTEDRGPGADLTNQPTKPGSEVNEVIDAGIKFVSDIEALAEKYGRVYIRWSPGSERDLTGSQQSRDFRSIEGHGGLSSVEITGDMHQVDIAKRLSEYGFLRMQDRRSVPHVYLADRIGTDSDGYATIKPKQLLLDPTPEVIKAIDSKLADVMGAMDDIVHESKKLEQYPGHAAITERLESAKVRLDNLLRPQRNSGVSSENTNSDDSKPSGRVPAQGDVTNQNGGFQSRSPSSPQSYPSFSRSGQSSGRTMLSRSGQSAPTSGLTVAQQADAILAKKSGTARPVDAVLRSVSNVLGITATTKAAYAKGAHLLDLMVPEKVKAGVVADYGIPGAVLDERASMTGRQRRRLRGTGTLLEKLATLTRAESRVAYQWLNNDDPQAAAHFEAQLPAESLDVLNEVRDMIDDLSKEAIKLGQLSQDAYDRNKYAYLHRSYVKHTTELTKGEAAQRRRAVGILGAQYKGRGIVDAVGMQKIAAVAPDWWKRKTQGVKADVALKGERFVRYERHANTGAGTAPLAGMAGRGKGKLLEVLYWPAGEPTTSRLGDFDAMPGVWEVRDVKGKDAMMWRDFSAEERENMGEIDEARFAIAKTLHGMIQDIETGKYLQWLADNHSDATGAGVTGTLVDASDRMRDVFKPGEWVQVPETKIPGTQVAKYGALSGRFIPGPIWNDVRQTVGFRFQPLGEIYAKVLNAWKISKALALDTPIPTPSGWTTMGELQPGDTVFDETGTPCTVLQATETQYNHQCYEVEFSDGTKVVADAGHLWHTEFQGRPGIRETREIVATLKERTRGDNNHRIPVSGALALPEVDLPIPPYALGVWLGDGDTRSARITAGGADVEELRTLLAESGVRCGISRKDSRNNVYTFQMQRAGFGCMRGHDAAEMTNKGCRVCANESRRNKLAGVAMQPAVNQPPQVIMRAMGVLGHKHIPATYLRASEAQRRELLKGLMDSDGHITDRGLCGFCTVSDAIKDGMVELLRSLGYKPRAVLYQTRCNGRAATPAWKIHFKAYADRPVFKLARKVERLCPPPATRQRSQTRQIVSVREVQSVPVRCILVSSSSHLFLAGDGMVPTHNTALSPAVHMNNVMSNFVMADWADVSAGHVLKALKLLVADDAASKAVLDRFSDSGGGVGTWATAELKQDQLRPLLEAIERDLHLNQANAQVGVFSALQLALHGKFADAAAAAAGAKTATKLAGLGRAMLNAYEMEDRVFRLAAFVRAKEEGASDHDAGKVARKSFLDYHINAPWIQGMRQSAFPFVSFTYRAVPLLIDTAANKPWKLAKLAMFVGVLNALGYAASGGDEDDERKLLPEEKAGDIWGLVPKLVRMPWNDAQGAPVFLDVRRWVPVGDVFDIGAGHAAVPLLPAMMPGGPLVILGEVVANKSMFTGKAITQETDTAGETTSKALDHLYKAFAPNIGIMPGTYAYTGIVNAGKGVTDSFGAEKSLTQAIVSSVGVKLGSYPKEVLLLNETMKFKAMNSEIDKNIAGIERQYARHGIDEEEFLDQLAAEREKKMKLIGDLQKKLNGS